MFFRSFFFSLPLFTLFTLLFSFSPAAQAQSTAGVDNAKLKKFAAVNKKIQKKQQKMQGEMVKAIEKHGLSLQKFNQIAQSQGPQPGASNPAGSQKEQDHSKEDMAKFKKASQGLQAKQVSFQQEVKSVIEGHKGITVSQYQQIAEKIRSSQELQKRYQEMVQ